MKVFTHQLISKTGMYRVVRIIRGRNATEYKTVPGTKTYTAKEARDVSRDLNVEAGVIYPLCIRNR